MLDLYAGTWQGGPLTADEYVISADEKTCHPGNTIVTRSVMKRLICPARSPRSIGRQFRTPRDIAHLFERFGC